MAQPSPRADEAAAGPSVAAVQAAWPTVLDRLAGESRVAWTVFHAAAPVSLSQGVLAVAVSEPGNLRAIAQRGHDERLRQALIDVLGLDVRIDVLHDPDAARGNAAGTGRPSASAIGGSGPASAAQAAPPAQAAGSAPERKAASGEPGDASVGEVVAYPPAPGQSIAQAKRGVQMVRAAASTSTTQEAADEPSEDDPDLSGADGLALITRELGARPIGEIDHS
jgi:DNA polymerase-3 subunit gamma/tau